MRLATLGLASLLATVGLSALLAQTVDGIDVAAVKKRAADLQADAQAFVDHVKDRGDAFREDAARSRDDGMANMRRIAARNLPTGPAGAIDFDAIVKGAASNAQAPSGDAPQFIVFASLSMPAASLRPLIADTARAGGVVVFRGFPANSGKEFVEKLGQAVGKAETASIGIDPRLFRAFDVQAVPTFVAVSSSFDLCAGFECRTRVPPHDRLEGNVTVDYALDAFAGGAGPGARVAAVALQRLHRSPTP
jgi:conjugal transfer pilus assembly protein TrbC